MRAYTERKAAREQAQVERLAAIDLGGEPCSWKAIAVHTVPIPLRLGLGLPPFARFSSGVLSVKFEGPAPTAANVMTDGGGILLNAVADIHDVTFYPAQPLTLAGFVRLHPSARLSASRVENALIDLSYRLTEPTLSTVRPGRLSTKVPCSAVGLVEQRLQAEATRCFKDVALSRNQVVPLASSPRGAVVARLAVEQDTAVDILEQRSGQLRIELSGYDYTIFGWVPARAVTRDAFALAACMRRPPVDDHHWPTIDETSRCSSDIPLAIEQGSRRRQVGLIRAGTTFEIIDRRPDAVRVGLYADSGLLVEPNTSFVIEPAALDSCRLRSPPRLSERLTP